MMTYEDIRKANSEIKMLDLKGKDYAMVPQRVTAFRKLFPEGFITTEILSNDGETVLMQAKVGYFREDKTMCILGTGFAQEVKGKGMVNGTSHIENCETSAVGRALGFLGLGIDGGGICSAEELVNAITAQNQNKKASTSKPEAPKAEPKPEEPKTEKKETVVGKYVSNEIAFLAKASGESYADMRARFKLFSKQLVESGKAQPIDWSTCTIEQAKVFVEALKAEFYGDAV